MNSEMPIDSREFFRKPPVRNPPAFLPDPPAGGKSAEQGESFPQTNCFALPRHISIFNHLDFARNSFELCQQTPQDVKNRKTQKNKITENESKDEIIWQIPEYEYNQKIFLGIGLFDCCYNFIRFCRLAEEFSFCRIYCSCFLDDKFYE